MYEGSSDLIEEAFRSSRRASTRAADLRGDRHHLDRRDRSTCRAPSVAVVRRHGGGRRNPARIIPAWRSFVDEHDPDRPLRGIGQPIWAERSPQELVECERHESLLNLAFAGSANMWLLCPYDVSTLDSITLQMAERTHPSSPIAGKPRPSDGYQGLDAARAPFAAPLPEAPADAVGMSFDADSLSTVRTWAAERAVGVRCAWPVGPTTSCWRWGRSRPTASVTAEVGARCGCGPKAVPSSARYATPDRSPIRSWAAPVPNPTKKAGSVSGSRTSSAISCRSG